MTGFLGPSFPIFSATMWRFLPPGVSSGTWASDGFPSTLPLLPIIHMKLPAGGPSPARGRGGGRDRAVRGRTRRGRTCTPLGGYVSSTAPSAWTPARAGAMTKPLPDGPQVPWPPRTVPRVPWSPGRGEGIPSPARRVIPEACQAGCPPGATPASRTRCRRRTVLRPHRLLQSLSSAQ